MMMTLLHRQIFILCFILGLACPLLSQKVKTLPDERLTPLTIKTGKEVRFKVKERAFRPLLYSFKSGGDNGDYYFKLKRRKVILVRSSSGGKTDIPVLNFVGGAVVAFGGGSSYRSYLPQYGLRSAVDSSQLLPMEYTEIDTLGKELYVLHKWKRKAIYFRNPGLHTAFFDKVIYNPVTKMIALQRGDSATLLGIDGRTRIKMLRGSITLDAYGAVISEVKPGSPVSMYLDTNFLAHRMPCLNPVGNFFNGVGIGKTGGCPIFECVVNLDGKIISEGYLSIEPFFNKISYARTYKEKYVLMKNDGTLLTDSGFSEVKFYYSNPDLFTDRFMSTQVLEKEPLKNTVTIVQPATGIAYLLSARIQDRIWFYDTLGNLMNRLPYHELKYESFAEYNLAVVGRKQADGKMLYTVVDRRLKEISAKKYAEIKILFPGRHSPGDYVKTTDLNGESKNRSFKEWLLELVRN